MYKRQDKRRHRAEHLIEEEDKLWDLAHITDVFVDNLINNNADSSNDTSSDIDMVGIELLSDSKW